MSSRVLYIHLTGRHLFDFSRSFLCLNRKRQSFVVPVSIAWVLFPWHLYTRLPHKACLVLLRSEVCSPASEYTKRSRVVCVCVCAGACVYMSNRSLFTVKTPTKGFVSLFGSNERCHQSFLFQMSTKPESQVRYA